MKGLKKCVESKSNRASLIFVSIKCALQMDVRLRASSLASRFDFP